MENTHSLTPVQIQSFLWSIFSAISKPLLSHPVSYFSSETHDIYLSHTPHHLYIIIMILWSFTQPRGLWHLSFSSAQLCHLLEQVFSHPPWQLLVATVISQATLPLSSYSANSHSREHISWHSTSSLLYLKPPSLDRELYLSPKWIYMAHFFNMAHFPHPTLLQLSMFTSLTPKQKNTAVSSTQPFTLMPTMFSFLVLRGKTSFICPLGLVSPETKARLRGPWSPYILHHHSSSKPLPHINTSTKWK